jgi:hypothetical protein
MGLAERTLKGDRMEVAMTMLKEDPHAERNKRIIIVTDDEPNIWYGAG